MIDYIGAGGTIPTAQNTGEQEDHGLEIAVEWDLGDKFKLRSNLAYQRSENKETGSPVPNAPEYQLYLNPHWCFTKDWSLDSQFYWIGRQHWAKGDPRGEIDDYGLVNLTLRRKNITGYLDAAVAIRNLFDEDGRTPSPYDPNAPEGAFIPNDYPIEGRSVWVELRCKF